jgi:hypothetical protein
MAHGDVRVRRRSGRWRVSVDGVRRTRKSFSSQVAAWEAARTLATRRQVQAILYRRDGRIRQIYASVTRTLGVPPR